VDTAADMLFALMSSGVLESLTIDRGWSTEQFRDHLAVLLRSTFVRPEDARAG
jgi:hypothetical protein